MISLSTEPAGNKQMHWLHLLMYYRFSNVFIVLYSAEIVTIFDKFGVLIYSFLFFYFYLWRVVATFCGYSVSWSFVVGL